MTTLPSSLDPAESHKARGMAESFGSDAARYDRARPRYPQALADRIIAASPGRDVLDVGIGTGIAALGFRAAGCRVLGVDVDGRMAGFAREQGFAVEVARFEDWDPAGRAFDIVIAGQTWHWIDPGPGAAKAAQVLRPGGRIAIFWNAFQFPPDLAASFAAIYARVLPGSPFARGAFGGPDAYAPMVAKTSAGLEEAGSFGPPEEWRAGWERTYTRDEWLDMIPTAGGFNQLPRDVLDPLLSGIAASIDAAGGSFTMSYVVVTVTAARMGAA